jgi:hypothetical protein
MFYRPDGDLYLLLGVSPRATRHEIRQAIERSGSRLGPLVLADATRTLLPGHRRALYHAARAVHRLRHRQPPGEVKLGEPPSR